MAQLLRRGVPARRPTQHRDRALAELDALMTTTDRAAALQRMRDLTAACVAAARATLEPPTPKRANMLPPPPAAPPPVAPLSPAPPPRRPLPSSAALQGLSPGSALKRLRELRAQGTPVAEEREVQEGSEDMPPLDDADDDAWAFPAARSPARSPAFGGAPPSARSPAKARSPRSPAPRLSPRQADALRAALARCVRTTAAAVAAELEEDPAVAEAFGARPLGLAVGFLRTLGEGDVDQRAVGEIVARSAAAAGGKAAA